MNGYSEDKMSFGLRLLPGNNLPAYSTMRRFIIITFITTFGCSTNNHVDSVNGCPIKTFSRKVDKYEIKATYADCEPDWKSHLTISSGGKAIYTADSLLEFEFRNHSWPDFLKVSDRRNQMLFEVNDRPYSNYILCITVDNDVVVGVDRFHSFNYEPKDFDSDGLLEYAGYPYTVEGYTNDSIYYNPIQYVEKAPSGFRIDTALTRLVNIKFYGEFPGVKSKIYPEVSADTVSKYLNVVEN